MKQLKKLSKILLASSTCLALTACGGDSGKSEEHIDAKEKFGCNVLNVYNAGEYIGEDVISTFELVSKFLFIAFIILASSRYILAYTFSTSIYFFKIISAKDAL